MKKLTPKQIENWRKTLFVTLGPYAWTMSEEEIETVRAKMNASFATLEPEDPDKYCVTTPDGDCISTDPRCMHNKVRT
jgi:hypothetical protein